jgi:hypothetical protein
MARLSVEHLEDSPGSRYAVEFVFVAVVEVEVRSGLELN